MRFQLIDRGPDAFQQPVAPGEIEAMCARAFGAGTRVVEAAELGNGMYNSTFRVSVAGQERPVILRVAPEVNRQFSSERELMRNEYASVPYLARIAALMPRVISADFTHEVVARDYMFQTYLDGVPGPDRIGDYPRSAWPVLFRQMGVIARDVHAVCGPHFGPITGPAYGKWSAAVTASLQGIAGDLECVGLDAADVRGAAAAGFRHSEVLDEITVPHLLAGDLWTVNVMLDETALEPSITGVFDLDRTWWGDPAADWTIRMAMAKPGTERDSFWETYGPPDRTEAGVWRSRIYEARHLAAIRLERHRLGNAEGVKDSYGAMAAVVADLA
ncbi:MAG: aminoglycoside phosphotransferase family protein [Streptosporangiaceae bacterium]